MAPPLAYRHDLGNDRWIVEKVFPGLRGGFFIEAGATNGISGSATFTLERRLGWTGILVETIPVQFERLADFRPASRHDNRALWRTSGETLSFSWFPTRAGRSGLTETNWHRDKLVRDTAEEILQVETVTLADLLVQHAAPPVIDYLCLDIEGAEHHVLGAFDFHGPHKIRALSVEGHSSDPILRAAGYLPATNPFTDVAFETYWLHPDLADRL